MEYDVKLKSAERVFGLTVSWLCNQHSLDGRQEDLIAWSVNRHTYISSDMNYTFAHSSWTAFVIIHSFIHWWLPFPGLGHRVLDLDFRFAGFSPTLSLAFCCYVISRLAVYLDDLTWSYVGREGYILSGIIVCRFVHLAVSNFTYKYRSDPHRKFTRDASLDK